MNSAGGNRKAEQEKAEQEDKVEQRIVKDGVAWLSRAEQSREDRAK